MISRIAPIWKLPELNSEFPFINQVELTMISTSSLQGYQGYPLRPLRLASRVANMGWIANHTCSKQTQKRRLVRECLQFQTKWCVKLRVASIETYLAGKLFCSQLRTCSTAIVRDDCVQPQSPILQDLSGQKCAQDEWTIKCIQMSSMFTPARIFKQKVYFPEASQLLTGPPGQPWQFHQNSSITWA